MTLGVEQKRTDGRYYLARAEPLLVAIAAPLLLFPHGVLPWAGLGLVLLGWVLRGLGLGKWAVRTPLDRPAVAIFLMAVVSLYPSVDLGLSMPMFFGILFGLLVYYATVSNVVNERRFWLGIALLIAGLVLIALLGLVDTAWITGKNQWLQRIYGLIPHAPKSIQALLGRDKGFHPNMIGMTLAFLLPVPAALLLRVPLTWPKRGLLGATVLLGLGVLVISVSRSALVGITIAFLVLLIAKWRRAGLALLLVMAVAFGVALSVSGQPVADFLLKIDATTVSSGSGSLPGRLEVWDRARYMIEDFPFTGIGLNTFPVIMDTLYPSFLAGPDAHIPHAHNLYLQTAVDLGLGGLLGFLGLFACVGYAGWQAYRRLGAGHDNQPALQAAVLGLLAGLLAYLVSGLIDATQLGTRQTVLLWLMMGLIVSVRGLADSRQPSAVSRQGSGAGGRGPGIEGTEAVSGRRPLIPGPRSLALGFLRLLGDTYWLVTFLFVGLGFVVVGMGVSGWVP